MVRNVQKTKKSSSKSSTKNLFGGISTINTAPVAIGNSLRGSQAQTIRTPTGVRVVGRDLAFVPRGTSTITTWTLVGGIPLTPACLPSSILRNYTQMYNKFKINEIRAHYITSSPTSVPGDILFYYNKNRDSPLPNPQSTSFIPYVLSDANTVMGPIWTNHSMLIKPVGPFKTTNVGMLEDLNEQAFGELFLYSKQSSGTNSPGYVVIDYDISFNELSVNPRAGVLPDVYVQYQNCKLSMNNTAVTSGVTKYGPVTWNVSGALLDGATGSVPTNFNGCVWRVILDITNSAFGVAVSTNTLKYRQGAYSTAISLKDGFTCYAATAGNDQVILYQTLAGAVTQADNEQFLWGVTDTVNVTFMCWFSLCGYGNSILQQMTY
jgi:hypothetical protein